MNNRKKIIITIIAVLILISSVSAVFAWFYFPNSKGLEIDTAPALDFDIEVYKMTHHYDEKGNYTNSSLDYLPENGTYTNKAGQTVNYLNGDVFTVPDSYEFFQWGDEFICEDDVKAHYYALKISYDSNVYEDGYIKSVIQATLTSTGEFVGEGEVTYNANFPVIKTSYKFASSADILSDAGSAMTEMRADTGYKEIINGTDYFTKSGNNYTLVDRYVAFDSTATYYTSDIAKAYPNTSNFSAETYYTLNNHVFSVASSYVAGTQYYTGTFTETSIDGYAASDASYSLGTLNYDIETVFYQDLLQTQYLLASTDTIQFVLLIKLEPDEALVTSKMDEFSDVVGDLTSIDVTNVLSLDVRLRSVPHKEGTINND